MNNIEFIDDKFEVIGRNCEFTKEIKQEFSRAYDICHGISFNCMATALCNALNRFYYNRKNIDIKENFVYILGIIYAVKRLEITDLEEVLDKLEANQPCDEDGIDEYREYLFKLIKVMEKIQENNEDEILLEIECDSCSYYTNKILELLYNEMANLHPGDSKWNKSLGGAFDPVSYVLREEGFILDDPDDCIAITNLLNFTLGEDSSFSGKNALFFYTGKYDEELFMYSSNNEFNFLRIGDVEPCKIPIFYSDYIEQDNHKEIEL